MIFHAVCSPIGFDFLDMNIVTPFLLALLPVVYSVNVKTLLDTTYTDGSGNNVTLSDLSGKYIALYFSASWCPDCQAYTPQLVEVYNKIHEAKNWQVIWVTADRNEEAANEYFKEMPWIRLNWSEKSTRGEKMFKLSQQLFIPAVTMVDTNYNVINPEASEEITGEPRDFPWEE